MLKGAKLGWIMMTASVALSAWMFLGENAFSNIIGTATSGSSQSKTAKGEKSGPTISGDFEINDTTLVHYNGSGGTVELPDNIKTIAAGAFKDKPVTQVTNDDNLTTIDDGAFYHTSLSSYSIPTGLLSLHQGAFRKCEDLKAFSGGSNYYLVRGGCIYSDGGRALYIVPEGKGGSVEVASGTQIIAKGALEGCDQVTTLYIPKSVKKIKGLAKSSVSTIYGYNGTYAAEYATAKQIKFVAIGGEAPSNSAAAAGSQSASAGAQETAGTQSASANTQQSAGTQSASANTQQSAGAQSASANTQQSAGAQSASANTQQPAGSQSTSASQSAGATANSQQQGSRSSGQTAGTRTASAANLPTDGSAGSGNGTHTLDSTPKTADGDLDPRFVFCAALLCVGIAVILFSYRTSVPAYAAGRMAGIRDDELD